MDKNLKNVYDFDKTIYAGDSTTDFYFFLLKKNPGMLFYLPYQGFWAIPFAFKLISKTGFKEKFYSCFKAVRDIDKEINAFWEIKKDRIKNWYRENQREDDIIISASPEFLLRPICNMLGIRHLMASVVDKKTGKYTGENCYAQEKVNRLKKSFPNVKINEFYSDSFSDQPLASLAKKAYLVVGDKLYDWDKYKKGEKVLK